MLKIETVNDIARQSEICEKLIRIETETYEYLLNNELNVSNLSEFEKAKLVKTRRKEIKIKIEKFSDRLYRPVIAAIIESIIDVKVNEAVPA